MAYVASLQLRHLTLPSVHDIDFKLRRDAKMKRLFMTYLHRFATLEGEKL